MIVDMIVDFDFLSSAAFRESGVVERTSVFFKEWSKLLVWPCFVMYFMDLLISFFLPNDGLLNWYLFRLHLNRSGKQLPNANLTPERPFVCLFVLNEKREYKMYIKLQ